MSAGLFVTTWASKRLSHRRLIMCIKLSKGTLRKRSFPLRICFLICCVMHGTMKSFSPAKAAWIIRDWTIVSIVWSVWKSLSRARSSWKCSGLTRTKSSLLTKYWGSSKSQRTTYSAGTSVKCRRMLWTRSSWTWIKKSTAMTAPRPIMSINSSMPCCLSGRAADSRMMLSLLKHWKQKLFTRCVVNTRHTYLNGWKISVRLNPRMFIPTWIIVCTQSSTSCRST